MLIAQKYAAASYPLLLGNETTSEGYRPLIKSKQTAKELEHSDNASFQLFKCQQEGIDYLNSTFWEIRHTSKHLCVSMHAPPTVHPKGSIGFQLRTEENRLIATGCAGASDEAFYDQVFYEKDNLHLLQYNALKNQTRFIPQFDGQDVYLVEKMNNWEDKYNFYLFFSMSRRA
ncbi:hypothetical protein MNAN1_002781 [Malassezia nana]|uniref:Uncharacterized protein n=1 Tax=Malassezia nana TaxID=180528 RepID=A0AAF0EMW3_9BASI|nr:hypothetical protein MNAN1_002781 [Malassezia nana]